MRDKVVEGWPVPPRAPREGVLGRAVVLHQRFAGHPA